MWIRTDVIICCLNIIRGALLIGIDVAGRFHDQFQVLYGLYQMRNDAVMTESEVICVFEKRWENITTNLGNSVDWNR
jgi:hypothetical protein